MLCVFCSHERTSRVSDACPHCGFADPLLILDTNDVPRDQHPSDTFTMLNQLFHEQLRSETHRSAVQRASRFWVSQDIERTRQDALDEVRNRIDSLNDRLTNLQTMIDAYENQKYVISLRDHKREVEARSEDGLWGVVPCPMNDCPGRVFRASPSCSMCQTRVCFRCLSPDHDGQPCNPEVQESVRVMMQSCTPCPMCYCVITKHDGCDQMFCTKCTHPFDYLSGTTIPYRNLHNPHFFEHQAQQRNDNSDDLHDWLKSFMQRQYEQRGRVQNLKPNPVVEFDDDGWVTSLKIQGREHVFQIGNWIRSAWDFMRTTANRCPDTLDVPDRELVIEKIRWLENPDDTLGFENLVKLMCSSKQGRATKKLHWTMIRHFLDFLYNTNYVAVQFCEVGITDPTLFQVPVDLLTGCNEILDDDTRPETVLRNLKAWTAKVSKQTKDTCCVCFGKSTSVSCASCRKTTCVQCLETWGTSDSCKIDVTMPCCRESVWETYLSLHHRAKAHRMLTRLLAQEQREYLNARKYVYTTFLENKQHCDLLRKEHETANKEYKAAMDEEKTLKRTTALQTLLTISTKDPVSSGAGAMATYYFETQNSFDETVTHAGVSDASLLTDHVLQKGPDHLAPDQTYLALVNALTVSVSIRMQQHWNRYSQLVDLKETNQHVHDMQLITLIRVFKSIRSQCSVIVGDSARLTDPVHLIRKLKKAIAKRCNVYDLYRVAHNM